MDPQNLSEFVGHTVEITQLTTWLNVVTNDIKYKQRICFLTGSISCGKTTLVKLILKKHSFKVYNFSALSLRIKKQRKLLYQTIQFKDILDIGNNVQYKAIVIDDIEGMGQAKQEIFKKIKEMIKRNTGYKIPIILIGVSNFNKKIHLPGVSIHVQLNPRTLDDLCVVQKKILKELNIEKDEKEILTIAKKSGGDIRKILQYYSAIKTGRGCMETYTVRGGMGSLYKILCVTSFTDILDIHNEILYEKNILQGIYSSYISYVNFCFGKNHILNKDIATILAFSSNMNDFQRRNNLWDFEEISNTISSWGVKTLLGLYNKKKKNTIKKYWWDDIKNKKDKPIESLLFIKNNQSILCKTNISKKSFKMIDNNISHFKSWRPKYSKNTLVLYKLSLLKY